MRVSALARITRERGNENETGCVRTERSSVHCPFRCRSFPVRRPFFFKQAPVVRIERGNFFLKPTVHVYLQRVGVFPRICKSAQ